MHRLNSLIDLEKLSERLWGHSSQDRSAMNILKATWLETPLGPMVAISDDESLYLLEFFDRKGLSAEIEYLVKKKGAHIISATAPPLVSIKEELKAYFNGSLKKFETPFSLRGTDFQKLAWNALTEIPYGETRSYMQQAEAVNRSAAHRAVANANGANQLAIIIPCHRIINANGQLGGYGAGLARKKWLIEHERRHQ
ncbi:MAG: methylated-DNA--[protein]-cysteine S-methyltransferase [Candidatus Paracaedibacteraceae bacterium]|nr:methylated-DNA--[protein]-cysteine S-methyltransferase [Candidatus Paracaedibacteraceae bacterium]